MTHAASQPITGKNFMYKYFNVQTPGDECADDVCDCSSEGAPDIQQGRVYTTREISPSPRFSPPPGNGFGLHLVSVPGHKTTGGLSVEEVESHFKEKLGDMSAFDSFMDFNVVFATSSLQSYKDAFDLDGVKYLVGSWSDSQSKTYSSMFVQVPDSQLVLELVQQIPLTLAAAESAVQLEQRVPDSVLFQQQMRLSSVEATNTTKDYIVPLVVNRAVSPKAMAQLEAFYVDGMGTNKTHDAKENKLSKKCFLWPGASVNICFTQRDDSATSTSFKVGDFEDMLNNVHKSIIEGHPMCQMDRWFDNHYAIDSHSVSSSKILAYINSKKPYHTCSGAGLSAVWDPTGLGIQMDTGTGFPDDCSGAAELSFLHASGGKSNPACTIDTSNCGALSSDLTV